MALRPSVIARPQPATKRLEVKSKDKNFHYAWINFNKEGRVEVCRELGYEVVTRGDAKDAGDVGLPDNAVRTTNLVLMRCPRSKYDERRKALREFNRVFHNRALAEYRNRGEQLGVEVVDESRVSHGPLHSGEDN